MDQSFLSHRIASIKPSATLALTQKAAELKAQGQNIISLSAGEPDFDTPSWVCEAAIKAIHSGQTKYTPVSGTPALKQAIIKKFMRDNALEYTPDQIIASTGGKQVIFNALLATLNAGDEVIIPAPYWVSYPDMVDIAGGAPVFVSCPMAQSFKMTPQQLENALTAKTKWVILNAPSNPTGVLYSYEELWQLAQILRQHPRIMILSDDIYEPIIYEQNTFHTMAAVEPELKERTLTMNGLSKAYSMTGWRLGYGAGPSWLIKAMDVLQSQSTSNPCSITQAAAISALEGPQDFLANWVQAFQERRDLVLQKLAAIPGLSCLTPAGAFYAFPSCQALLGSYGPDDAPIATDTDFCRYLLDSAGVAVVPGSAFGQPGHFRISYATDLETITNALDRIAKAVCALKTT